MTIAYTKINQFVDSAKPIGSFSAYVRRPLPQVSGLIAQFYGPNGEDSDSILALSLTRYLDAEVLVTVYLIKNADGVIMKQADGKYPQISQFFAVIRRGKPTRGGMLAEFFATNGANSDQVNELGKSVYQDCLVYIDIRGKLVNLAQLEDPKEIIDSDYASKVSQHEINEYKKGEKQFSKLNKKLYFEFLKTPEVVYKLGGNQEFIEWLSLQGCCWPNHCTKGPLHTYKIKSLPNYFNYLVFCEEHLAEIEEGEDKIPGEALYLKMKNTLAVQNWAFNQLKIKFSLTGKEEPDSRKIASWARENGIEKYLPEDFKKLI